MMLSRILFLLCVFLPVEGWAFPQNGVLETFTGTDGTDPPNANWTNHEIYNGFAGLNIRSNAAAPSASGGLYYGGYYNVQTYGPDSEAYGTIINIGSTAYVGACVRLSVPGGDNTADGYCAEAADGASQVKLYRIDNAAVTTLATYSQTVTTTDSVGISAIGSSICAWFNDSGGGWSSLGCVTDSTYTSAGYIGLYINGSATVGAVDDFGGGTIVARRIAPIIFP